MNHREMLALSGALAAATIAGCMGDGQPLVETETEATATEAATMDTPTETPSGEPPTGESSADNERLAAFAAGNAEFALDLHKQIASEQGGNQLLSPYNISIALAMTYAGAHGKIREQMEATLRYALDENVHPVSADLRAAFEERETARTPIDGGEADAFRLAVVNVLWGREGLAFSGAFLDNPESNCGARPRRADFAGGPNGEQERINEWVADQAEGRIEDLLPAGPITPDTAPMLTNAIYLMAQWTHTFDSEDTEDGTFTVLGGSESTMSLIRQELKANYANFPSAQTVELPYVGRDVSMVFLLPDEGEFELFEQSLTTGRLLDAFEEMRERVGDVVLPRFELEAEVQLSEALSGLGMPTAPGLDADSGGMIEGDGSGLATDEVFHKPFISVDEEGAEAAAATGVVVEPSLPPSWSELRFDRPFLFCICDRPTDTILFYGRVVDAGAAQGDE